MFSKFQKIAKKAGKESKQKKSGSTKAKDNDNDSNNIESSSKQLAVAVHKNTGTAINYFISRAPGLIPVVVNTTKLFPKKKNNRNHINKEVVHNHNLPQSLSSFDARSNTLAPSSRRGSRSLNAVEIESGKGHIDHQRRPSEPTPLRLNNIIIIDDDGNYTPIKPRGVPAINIHDFDDAVIEREQLFYPVDHSTTSISNVHIIKEGYLNKKIDFDSKISSTSRGWKVYRVILRGSKLYFYKPPSEAVLKTFFPNNKDVPMGKDISSTLSPVIANDRGMNLNPSNFESNTAKLIFEGGSNPSIGGEFRLIGPLISKYYYGETCHEVDRSVAMRFKKHVCLLIFEDNIVICKRKWVRYTANFRPIMDAMGFGGGNHSLVNVSSSNGGVEFGGQDVDTRSVSSTRGIPESDGPTTNKGKGYYTKWKLDACYSIHSVEVIPDPKFPIYSPYIAPSSQPSYYTSTNRTNDIDTSSLHSASSSVSLVANATPSSGVILNLNITDGLDKDSYRVFVVSNTEVRSLWMAKLFDAKKASLRKLMLRQGGTPASPTYDLNPYGEQHSPVGLHDHNLPGEGGSNAVPTVRRRAYWGTDKHPELILKEILPEHENVSATTSPVYPSPPVVESQRLIRGGSIDSLIHELIFETQKELRRCGSMQSSLSDNDKRKKSNAISKRLITVLTIWCKNFARDLSRDEVYNEMMETVKVLINEGVTEGEELKKLIQETRVNPQSVMDDYEDEPIVSHKGPPTPFSLDLSNLLITGLTPALFLKMIPEELAQQLYIYHFLELKKTNPKQDLKIFVPSKHRPDSYTRENPLNANPAAPHFITRLIYHHILISTQQSAYTSRRPLLLTHWIKTGVACKALCDMTGWMAVASAICSPAIVRLKETWRRVDKQWINIIVKDWVPILVTCGGVSGEVDIENVKALLLVVNNNKEKNKTKPIPYFGFITLALERLNSTVPAIIDRSTNDTARVGSRNNSVSGSVINFVKYWRLYDTIIESLAQWQQAEDFNEFSEDSCPFSPSSPLQKYFHQLNSVPTSSTLDTWQLFDSSLSCEPILHGQYLEHHARQRKSHSTYYPLVFTEVIPTNRLFKKCAFLNASGTLGKRNSNSSLNLGDANPAVSSPGRSAISAPTNLNMDAIPASTSSKPNSPSHLSVHPLRGNVRKRTLSFPLARIGPLTSTTWNTGLDLVTRNWLGGLVQHRGGYTVLLKCMKDIAGVGEMLMFVKDGELVFKSVRDATGSRPASLVENSSGTGSKRNSAHGLFALTQQQNSPRTSIHANGDHDALMVVVKAGTLERLVDVLINGVASYSTSVYDDNGEPPLTIGKQGQLGINSEEYFATFFSTYRSFCGPILLLDILRKRFMNAKKVSKETVEPSNQIEVSPSLTRDDTSSKTESVHYDWNMVASIQSKVLKIFNYWISEFFFDFLDDLTLRNRLMHFINEARTEVKNWSELVTEEPVVILAGEIKDSLRSLKRLVIIKSLEPAYDLPDEKMTCFVNKVMSNQISSAENDNKATENNDNLDVPSLDHSVASDLLDSFDLTVLGLFEAITPQEWILTYEILETQSADVLGWYPKKQSLWISEDEILITDIFTTIQQTERNGKSKEYILNSLPRPIQSLCRMHYAIRNWVIQEIAQTSIECEKRGKRIAKLLDMILLSRKRMEKLDIYPKDETAKQDYEFKRGVPSFVESSIVSGLISPECRLFTRAWNDVAISRKGGLDSLDTLLQIDLLKLVDDLHPNFALVPCVGWLFERMLEICCNVPDMSFESEKLINYDKRRYVYNLTQIFVRLQHELKERSHERKPSVDVGFLMKTNSHIIASKSDFRFIKDYSYKENNVNATQRTAKFPKPFNKLISEQQDKIRRDQKERDRLAKDIRDTQNKLQKKQNELEKRSRTQQRPRNKSRVETFIKQVARPISIALANTWHSGNSANIRNLPEKSHHSSSKVALVINLINSEASPDYGITLDFVFRIVTEEGGQYLFQAIDNDIMNDWIRVINEAAIEGAEKRKTILNKEPNIEPKEEEVPDEPKTRSSVYGKDLETLMPDGKIPVLVEKCITEIEKRGLTEVGIYRLSGATNAVNKLRASFNKKYRDINVIASALKLFFRVLPEPIITYELYDAFIEADGLKDHDEKHYSIKDLLNKLPKTNYELLKRLIEHLERVTDFQEVNHMYASNLAIVFGPNLLKSRDDAKTICNLGHHNSIVKCLILQYHWFFNVEEEEVSETEYQDDLLDDPDIETSEPDGGNVTDDVSSFENSSGNDGTWQTNEPNYDESNNLINESGRRSIIEEHGEFSQENLQESIEESSKQGSDSEQQQIYNKHNYVEDINNRDSILTNVTEDLEGELEESLRVPEENTIHEQHDVPLKHSDITFEASHRDSALTHATEKSENESTAELVKKEDSKEQNINNILQNFSETDWSFFDNLSTTNATTNSKRKSRYSIMFLGKRISQEMYNNEINLIDFDSDYETLQNDAEGSNDFSEHLMDYIDNYKEHNSKLDIPLRPEQFVRQEKSESDVEILNRDPVI
ncbi:18714_t:CDS:2 [Funneliformis geosporum]|uniref:18714_t:CDS:1 n=1 Tax=Funneliformis geosporum TaxID=1117311 RepID=A0A9W4SKL3_9GLOM|nr:18714_t:CDS:2 [Funneliformis geosporum]